MPGQLEAVVNEGGPSPFFQYVHVALVRHAQRNY